MTMKGHSVVSWHPVVKNLDNYESLSSTPILSTPSFVLLGLIPLIFVYFDFIYMYLLGTRHLQIKDLLIVGTVSILLTTQFSLGFGEVNRLLTTQFSLGFGKVNRPYYSKSVTYMGARSICHCVLIASFPGFVCSYITIRTDLYVYHTVNVSFCSSCMESTGREHCRATTFVPRQLSLSNYRPNGSS